MLPAGRAARPGTQRRDVERHQRLQRQARLLPYMEQQSLFNAANFSIGCINDSRRDRDRGELRP